MVDNPLAKIGATTGGGYAQIVDEQDVVAGILGAKDVADWKWRSGSGSMRDQIVDQLAGPRRCETEAAGHKHPACEGFGAFTQVSRIAEVLQCERCFEVTLLKGTYDDVVESRDHSAEMRESERRRKIVISAIIYIMLNIDVGIVQHSAIQRILSAPSCGANIFSAF